MKTMARIAEKAEGLYDRSRVEQDFQDRLRSSMGPTDAIAHAVSDMARCLHPGAILTTTSSGQTPRLVSKFRPKQPILCATWDEASSAAACGRLGSGIDKNSPANQHECYHSRRN